MSQGMEDQITRMLSSSSFALIGAGQLGEMAVDLWPESVPQPKLILDSNRTGHCRGIRIDNLQAHHPDPATVYLLSTFKLPPEDVEKIFRQLGQPMVLTVYDLFSRYCPDKFSNGWRCLESEQAKSDHVKAARNCFSDQRSLDVFDAAVAWRYRRELRQGFTCEPEATKYHISRLAAEQTRYDLVMDCGSYDLSFAKNLEISGTSVGRYVAFEPDDQNFDRCLAAAGTLKPLTAEAVVLERKALSSEQASVPFFNLGLLSSRFAPSTSTRSEGPITWVPTTTLDQYLDSAKELVAPLNALLKLHIEGAEYAALIGGEQFISRCRPDMFINLSHDEESLLGIPVYLKARWDYDLKLVGHSLFGEGITLVAKRRTAGMPAPTGTSLV